MNMTEDAPNRGLRSAGKRGRRGLSGEAGRARAQRGSGVTEDCTVLGSDVRHRIKRSPRPRAGYCADDDVSLQFGRTDSLQFGRTDPADRGGEEGAGRQLALLAGCGEPDRCFLHNLKGALR